MDHKGTHFAQYRFSIEHEERIGFFIEINIQRLKTFQHLKKLIVEFESLKLWINQIFICFGNYLLKIVCILSTNSTCYKISFFENTHDFVTNTSDSGETLPKRIFCG